MHNAICSSPLMFLVKKKTRKHSNKLQNLPLNIVRQNKIMHSFLENLDKMMIKFLRPITMAAVQPSLTQIKHSPARYFLSGDGPAYTVKVEKERSENALEIRKVLKV